MEKKVRAARASIASNLLLVSMKLVVGFAMMSVSVISEAIHSMMDLLAAVIANLSVRMAVRPADTEHPYGHGKFENLSGVIEAILIFIAAALIIYESVQKLLNPHPVELLGIGVLIMGISGAVNYVVSRYLYKVAKEESSMALEADALHLKTDVWTSLGIMSGLAIIWVGSSLGIKGIEVLDPIIAICVAGLIIRAAWNMSKRSSADLLDEKLSPEEERVIEEALDKHSGEFLGYHSLRTRKAGAERFVDLHAVIKYNMTIEEGHHLAHRLENEITSNLDNCSVIIHLEPCDKDHCFQVNGTKVCPLDANDKLHHCSERERPFGPA